MGISFWQIALLVGFVMVPAGFALWFDKRNRERGQFERPYRWGYFIGGFGLLLAIPLAVFAASSAPSPTKELTIIISGVWFIGSIGVLKRATWGWVLILILYAVQVLGGIYSLFGGLPDQGGAGTVVGQFAILSINLWYASKRWAEMKLEPTVSV